MPSRTPTRSANQAPSPTRPIASPRSSTTTTGSARDTAPARHARQTGDDRATAARKDGQARQRRDLDREDHDQRDDPAGPDGRILAGDLGLRRVPRQERVGRVGQAVEMDRAAGDGHRPDGEDRGEGRDRLAQDDHHEAAERARPRAPTRPYAAAPVASRDELRTGIRVSIANAAAISPPGRSAALTRRGPAGGRAPGRRRTRPGWTSGPSAVAATRRQRCGRRP